MTTGITDPEQGPLKHIVLDDSIQRLLFLDARSATKFSPDPIPDEMIREVYELIRWAPTGNNSIPLRLVLAKSSESRASVIATAHENNRPKLERAPLIVVVARDDRFHDFFPVTSPGSESGQLHLENAPAERTTKAHDGTLIQLGYLIVGLRAAGLSVRPYGGFSRKALDELLLSDTSWHSEVLLGIGFPAGEDHGAGPRRNRLEWSQAAKIR